VGVSCSDWSDSRTKTDAARDNTTNAVYKDWQMIKYPTFLAGTRFPTVPWIVRGHICLVSGWAAHISKTGPRLYDEIMTSSPAYFALMNGDR
jgi:hypothetical protein